MRLPVLAAGLGFLELVLAPTPARADEPLRWHGLAGGALAVGDPQGHEYGLGAEGRLALEVPLGRFVGAQIELGGLWLPHANPPADKSLADHGDGTALPIMAGVRVRPFSEVAGAWADANLGYVRTGSFDRFGFELHAGYDWRVGTGRWDVGPYIGYLEVVQPKDSLRPEDAHILSIGVHVALGAKREPPPPAAAPLPPPPPPVPTGAPPSDRDGDGVPDAEDACPDIPGIKTDDPKTNGCPPAGDQVHVVKDHIEYDDVILFDTDQAHVHHASWPILRKLAQFIIANPDIEQVDITGHADERGSVEHNLRLSRARADAVRERLIHFGVAANRVPTIGYGESKPRAVGHTEAEWKQNRRVEFIVTKVRNVRGESTTLQRETPQTPPETPESPTPETPAPKVPEAPETPETPK